MRAHPTQFSKEEEKKILKLWDQFGNVEIIKKLFGLNKAKVRAVLRDHGIKGKI